MRCIATILVFYANFLYLALIEKGMSKISAWILRLFGWKIAGWDPLSLRQYVLIVLPHTSNWDFPLGLLVRSSLKWDIKFVAKDSLFRWPFGKILRWMGGYPVDRSKNNNYVDAVALIFETNQDFRLTIAPEGTRGKVEKLKSGFYYIARKAQVPIILVAFDYGKRIVKIADPITPNLTYEELTWRMKDFYRGVTGKNKELGFDFT